jgi:hypothetical protein
LLVRLVRMTGYQMNVLSVAESDGLVVVVFVY